MQRKLLGITSVDFDTTGQLLIIYIVFLEKGEGSVLNKLNILPSVESICRYFCISRLVPLLSSWLPLSLHFRV